MPQTIAAGWVEVYPTDESRTAFILSQNPPLSEAEAAQLTRDWAFAPVIGGILYAYAPGSTTGGPVAYYAPPEQQD